MECDLCYSQLCLGILPVLELSSRLTPRNKSCHRHLPDPEPLEQ